MLAFTASNFQIPSLKRRNLRAYAGNSPIRQGRGFKDASISNSEHHRSQRPQPITEALSWVLALKLPPVVKEYFRRHSDRVDCRRQQDYVDCHPFRRQFRHRQFRRHRHLCRHQLRCRHSGRCR